VNARKPTVKTLVQPPYARLDEERIVEFTFPSTGVGGLISFRTCKDGRQLVDIYRVDPSIEVQAPTERQPAKPAVRGLTPALIALMRAYLNTPGACLMNIRRG
jgi:hypothetical protein